MEFRRVLFRSGRGGDGRVDGPAAHRRGAGAAGEGLRAASPCGRRLQDRFGPEGRALTVFPVPQLSPEAQRVLAAAGLSSVVTELAPVPPVAPAGEAAPRGERRQDAEAQARQGAARPEAQPQQPAQARAGAPSSASQPAVRTPPAMPPILLPPRLAQAAGAAAQGAALAQDSLAPLMANLSQLDRQPDLPAPLRAALRAVMALQARPEALATPQGLKQALAASGLFLEARLARPRSEAESPRPTGDLKAALVRLQQAIG